VARAIDGGLKYRPVRGKMDTGSEENLIDEDVLLRAGISSEEMESLEEEHVFQGLERNTAKARYTAEVTRYLNRHMKSRINKSFVVKDALFDVLLGSEYITGSNRPTSAALILESRMKTRGEDSVTCWLRK